MQNTVMFVLVGLSLLTWAIGYATLPLRGRVPMQYSFSGQATWSLPVWAVFPLATIATLAWAWFVIHGGDGDIPLSVSFLIQGGAVVAVHLFLYFSGLSHKSRMLSDDVSEHESDGEDDREMADSGKE